MLYIYIEPTYDLWVCLNIGSVYGISSIYGHFEPGKMMTDDPPRWGDHHGWQRGDQRDDGGTDFLWCRCHQGLAAHPKSCKIAAIAPQIDVEHAKMRGYILASFFFLDFTACTFRPFPSRFLGLSKLWLLDAGCWGSPGGHWPGQCVHHSQANRREIVPLDPGIPDRDGIKNL